VSDLEYPRLAEELITNEGSFFDAIENFMDFCRELGSLPVSDAERAEEELIVFISENHEQHSEDITSCHWEFLVYGVESGEGYGSLSFAVLGDPLLTNVPLDVLGATFRIALNGTENAHPEDISSLRSLAGLFGKYFEENAR